MPDVNPTPAWPGWKTVRMIGSSAFSRVYEIRRDLFGVKQKAAMRVIRLPKREEDLRWLRERGYDETMVKGLAKEVLEDLTRYREIMRMEGSGNLVRLDGLRCSRQDKGAAWTILMREELLVPLVSFADTPFAADWVCRIAKDICSALVCYGKRKLVHGNIKPSSIFVAPDGTFKLDVNQNRILERSFLCAGVGARFFLAPECCVDQPCRVQSDLYSLGLLLYGLLNERRMPFDPLPPAFPSVQDRNEAIVRQLSGEKLPEPKNGGPLLGQIVLKACAFAPEERYQTAEEMLRDLEMLPEP